MTEDQEIIVDSFAGGGGASTGIELAGFHVHVAINHDADAIRMHAANHPGTLHLNSNIWQIDPDDIVREHGPVGLLWASPDCKHFSKAKGGKPVQKNIRDLAWTVCNWAERAKPRVIILENVEEFRTWGPLTEAGRPCPERSGETFERWLKKLRKAGYKVEHRELRACDYGAPTIRKRLFVIARRDGEPIVWPEPTHGSPDDPEVIAGNRLPWRTAAEIIDWSLDCPSIFMEKSDADRHFEETGVRLKRPLADNTLRRIAKGVQRYVVEASEPFIVTLNHGGEWQRGWSLGEPFRTVTAARDAHGLVVPHVTTMRNSEKPFTAGNEPLHTVTAGGARQASVQATLAPAVSYGQQGGGSRSVGVPLHTVTASSKDQNQVLAPTMVKFRADSIGQTLTVPAPTVTANSYLKRPGGASPLALLAPVLIPRYGERPGQEPRARSVEDPLASVVPTGNGASVVTAFMAQHNAGPRPGAPGRPVTAPMSTLMSSASQQTVVAASMINMKGTNRSARPATDPLSTITAHTVHAAAVQAFMVKYYGTDQDPRLDEPMHTITTRDRFSLVTVMVDGEPWVIVDIGLRMLTPRELFLAQGFPKSYRIDADLDGKPFTKSTLTSCAGNSVCPPLAEALVSANYEPRAVETDSGAKPAPVFELVAAE